MMIDCDSCTVRGAACTDCVVTFLTIPVRPSATQAAPAATPGGTALHPAPRRLVGATSAAQPQAGPVDLDEDERAAIRVLASSGLVPPLRMEGAM